MTSSPHLNYLLLDKDQTLGEFLLPGFYPSAIEFLTQQHDSQRNLVIATTDKTQPTQRDLQPINHLLHTSLCREHFRIQDQLGMNIKDFYLDKNGVIHELNNPKSPVTRYENPYSQDYISKDLHLARHYLDPKNYKNLRTIMLGDKKDTITARSDPYTPVIIISNQQRHGNWQPVSLLIDHLYHHPQKQPWQIFDEIHQHLVLHPQRRTEFHCKTKKDTLYGRIITMDE